jgi:molybdopterin adenylyltransferase
MKYRACIITVSDSAFKGEREDASGPALAAALTEAGFDVAQSALVPDDQSKITSTIQEMMGRGDIHLILTTGGTGFGPRDVTPEATRSIIEKPAPGIAELLRQSGAAQTPLTWLSRGEAGVAAGKLIINLPGSPKAMAHSIQTLKTLLEHALDLLNGEHPH